MAAIESRVLSSGHIFANQIKFMMKLPKKSGGPNTMAFAIFKETQTLEMQHYWYMASSIDLANLYLSGTEVDDNETLTRIKSLARNPYTYLDISPKDYREKRGKYLQYTLHNAVVQQITNLETYLFNTYFMTVVCNPTGFESKKQLDFSKVLELVANENPMESSAVWISDQMLRGNTTIEMISKVALAVHSGVIRECEKQVETIKKFVAARNAIVHNNRLATPELVTIWPNKFERANVKIEFSEKELIDLNFKLFEIVTAMDKRSFEVIGQADFMNLISEIQVQHGLENVHKVSIYLTQLLHLKVNKESLQTIAKELRNTRRAHQTSRLAGQLLKLVPFS